MPRVVRKSELRRHVGLNVHRGARIVLGGSDGGTQASGEGAGPLDEVDVDGAGGAERVVGLAHLLQLGEALRRARFPLEPLLESADLRLAAEVQLRLVVGDLRGGRCVSRHMLERASLLVVEELLLLLTEDLS